MRHLLNRFEIPHFEIQDFAPASFNDLNQCATGILKVWSGASEGTIWGDPAVNGLFRAWHDSVHLRHGLDFTPLSEYRAASIQVQLASERIGDSFAELIKAEVQGQVEYFERFKEFPSNQRAFIDAYLKLNRLPDGRY